MSVTVNINGQAAVGVTAGTGDTINVSVDNVADLVAVTLSPNGGPGPIGPQGPAGPPYTTVTVGSTTTLPSGSNATVTATSSNSGANLELAFGIPTGPSGVNGISPTIQIGTVTTGAAGSNAAATLTGTSNLTLNLTLPAGATGATGMAGAAGATGAAGPQGNTGPAGPASNLTIGSVTSGNAASANITGTPPDQILSLVLPKGDAGSQGPQGPAGSFGEPQTITTKTANHTLELADVGALLRCFASNGTITLTVPGSSSVQWIGGSHVDIVRAGAANVVVAAASGVSVGSSIGLTLRAQYSAATLIYLGGDAWILAGDTAT